MKLFLKCLLLIWFPSVALAQAINVSATITDPDGQVWANGTWTVQLYNASGTSYYGSTPVPTNSQSGRMDSAGHFVVPQALYNTGTINPQGAIYAWALCSNTVARCSTFSTPVGSADMSQTLSGLVSAPRFSAGATAYGYLDIEVTPSPYPGGTYYNVSTLTWRQWNGTAWGNVSSGGGGAGNPGGAAFSAQYNNSGTFGGASISGIPVFSLSTPPRTAVGDDINAILTHIYSISVNPPPTSYFYYSGAILSCSIYKLLNDPGYPVKSACLSAGPDYEYHPGYYYGFPGLLSGVQAFVHTTYDAPDSRWYGAAIHSWLNGNILHSAPGDINVYDENVTTKPSWIYGSDEGFRDKIDRVTEAGTAAGTVATTGAGATQINYNCSVNCNYMSLMTPFVNTNPAKVVNTTITALAPAPIAVTVNLLTVGATLPVSVMGTIAANIDFPREPLWAASTAYSVGQIVYNPAPKDQQVVTTAGVSGSTYPVWNTTVGGTTTSGSVVFTNTGTSKTLPSQVVTVNYNTPSPLTTGSVISIVQAPFIEQVQPIAVGTWSGGVQSVTASYVYPHSSGATFCTMPGPNYLEQPAFTTNTQMYLENILCTPTANTIWAGHIAQGSFSNAIPIQRVGEAVNLYTGGNIISVLDSSLQPANGAVTLAANASNWTSGDSYASPNNISALYNMESVQDNFNNPFAPNVRISYSRPGLVGAADGYGKSGYYTWIDNISSSIYGGVSGNPGLYYTPFFTWIARPVSNYIASLHMPLGATGQNVYGFGCVQSGFCNGTPETNALDQTFDIYRNFGHGGAPHYFKYDYANSKFVMNLPFENLDFASAPGEAFIPNSTTDTAPAAGVEIGISGTATVSTPYKLNLPPTPPTSSNHTLNCSAGSITNVYNCIWTTP